jgi:hypothetical protein
MKKSDKYRAFAAKSAREAIDNARQGPVDETRFYGGLTITLLKISLAATKKEITTALSSIKPENILKFVESYKKISFMSAFSANATSFGCPPDEATESSGRPVFAVRNEQSREPAPGRR